MLRDQVERELDAEAVNKELDALPLRQLEQDLRRATTLHAPQPVAGKPEGSA